MEFLPDIYHYNMTKCITLTVMLNINVYLAVITEDYITDRCNGRSKKDSAGFGFLYMEDHVHIHVLTKLTSTTCILRKLGCLP